MEDGKRVKSERVGEVPSVALEMPPASDEALSDDEHALL